MKRDAAAGIEKYADTVRRVCFMHLKNYHDVEDVFQEVFLKYVLCDIVFESDAHEKAWLIRVAINSCKDILKSFFRRKVTSINDLKSEPFYIPQESREILGAVLSLPGKYRDVIYLYYYEGYSAVEIAGILNKSENTIYTWHARAKQKLRELLGGEHLD